MPEFLVDSTTGVLRTASDLGEFGGSSFDVVVTATLRYGLSAAESQPAAMRVAVTPVTDASLALAETVNSGGCGGGCVAGVLVGLLLLLLLLVVLLWLCFKNGDDDDNEDDNSASMKANPTHYANQAFKEPTTARNAARHEAGLGLVRANVAGGAVSNGARNTPSNVIYSSANDTSMYVMPMEGGSSEVIYDQAAGKVVGQQGGEDSALPARAAQGDAAPSVYAVPLEGGGSVEVYSLAGVNASGAVAVFPAALYDVAGNVVVQEATTVYDQAGNAYLSGSDAPGNNNSTMPVYDLSTNLNTPVYAMAGAESSTDMVQCTRMGPKRMCMKPAVDGTLFCTGHTCPFPACNEGKSSKATCCSVHDGAEMPTSASPHGAGAPPIQRGASGRQSGTYGFGGDASSDERGGGGGITRNGRHHASVYDGFGPAEDNAEEDY